MSTGVPPTSQPVIVGSTRQQQVKVQRIVEPPVVYVHHVHQMRLLPELIRPTVMFIWWAFVTLLVLGMVWLMFAINWLFSLWVVLTVAWLLHRYRKVSQRRRSPL